MQKLPVYLYANLFTVILDLDNNKEINQIMYQRHLKLQKGIKNTVQLQFKNSDQKLVGVNGDNFVFNVYETSDNRSLVLSKNVAVLDVGSTATVYQSKGLGQIEFTAADTLNLETKNYYFSVTKVEDDGTLSPTYSDTYYGVQGVLELNSNVFPIAKPSIEITNFQETYNSTTLRWEYSSGNVRVYPDAQNRSGLSTVAFYLRSYSGDVYVEGTLENQPGTFANYGMLFSQNYNNVSGVKYVNVNGMFTHIRVRYRPKLDVSGQLNPQISGYFDKVLIRS